MRLEKNAIVGPLGRPTRMQFVFRAREQGTDAVEGEQRGQASARWKQEEGVALYDILEDGQRVYDAWIFPTNNGSFFVAGSKELAPFELADGE